MTKYDLFRRRIAPVAFGLAIVLIAREQCNKQERSKATFVLDFGAAQPAVKAVDAELWIGGSQIAVFHRNALAGGSIGDVRFDAQLPSEDAEVRIDVDLGDRHPHVVRHVHAVEGSIVNVPLGDVLTK